MQAHEVDTDAAYTGTQDANHRSPREAGAADRYYGRRYRPNFSYQGQRYGEEEMTAKQKLEYATGYDTETDRKQWS